LLAMRICSCINEGYSGVSRGFTSRTGLEYLGQSLEVSEVVPMTEVSHRGELWKFHAAMVAGKDAANTSQSRDCSSEPAVS